MRLTDDGTTSPRSGVLSNYNAIGVQFVLTELDLATTFCRLGLIKRDFNGAERNANNARAALRAVLRAKERLSFTREERELVGQKTSKIVCLLTELERNLIFSDRFESYW